MADNLEALLHKISTSAWEDKIIAGDEVVSKYGKEAVDALCNLLKSSSSATKNAAALALREIGDSRAIEPLFTEIKSPENRDNRSTFVYALENLDCRNHFQDITELCLASSADVRLAAMNVLHNHGFMMSDETLKCAHDLVNQALEKGFDPEWIKLLRIRLADFES